MDESFENVAERQYTRTLLFSSVVDLMGLVGNRIHPAVNAAFHALAETIGVAIKSVDNKLTTSNRSSLLRWSAPR